MIADQVAQAADRPRAARRPLAGAVNARQDRFWYGVAFAAAVHAALIFGVTRSSPRQMGELGGRPDGISVLLVDEADLTSKNTFREDGGASSAPAMPTPPAPPPAPQPPPKKSEPLTPKEAPSPAAEAAPPAPRPPDEQKNTARGIEKGIFDSLPPPGPAAKPSEPRTAAKPPPKEEQQTKPPLDLTMPNMPVAPGGRGAAVARPPGATRSGENDEFGRGVIRALRQTMPGHTGQFGRVTVRLLLSDKGNIVEVQLIRGSSISSLDQSVVFAVRQASFPFPPVGATVVDRTFLVTYIYN